MANAFKGQVSITHEGERLTLTLDFNALADFEGETGRNALEVLEAFERKKSMSLGDMRAFIWAALIQEHPEMTLKDAGRILSSNRSSLSKMLAAIQPDPAPAGEEDTGAGKPKARKKARASR